ncbi:MAG: DUF805 domain-containing protein [Reyranellaceae bacterium]
MKDLLFSFNGRINRAKFWLGTVCLLVVYIILAVISSVAMTPMTVSQSGQVQGGGLGIVGIIVLIFYIAMIWPSVALGVKRFHDRDKSGWWVLISLVPIIGGLWYLIECGFLEGTKGPNKFGPDPLAQA